MILALLALSALLLPGGQPQPPGISPAEQGRAFAVLADELATQTGSPRLHAAEALIVLGRSATVRPVFERAAAAGPLPIARIGIWRVLAQCSRSPEERERYIRPIERAFLDPRGPDRVHAIESLSELGCILKGDSLRAAEEMAENGPVAERPMALWEEILAGKSDTVARLSQALASPDAIGRLRAAFILGWVAPAGREWRADLSAAADREPPGTDTFAYVLSAAYIVNPAARHRSEWENGLEWILAHGSPTAHSEAARALVTGNPGRSRAYLVPYLSSPDPEIRGGAAAAIFAAWNRPGSD